MLAPDLLSPEFETDPNPLLAEMVESYPVFYHDAMQSYVL
jgi:cytochrome P450